MMFLRSIFAGNRLIRFLTATAFLSACPGLLYAQLVPGPPTRPLTPREIADNDMANREWQLRNIGKGTRKELEVGQPHITLAQIKKEYEGLQTANNEILLMLQAGTINYNTISDATTEIKKRASRLRSYLMLLEIVKENKKERNSLEEIEPDRIKPSLLSLDSSIVSLISNSVFKNLDKVVDTRDASKARDDLDNIIRLSDRIKRSIERSTKAASR